jgi:hypothetical protein
VFSSFFVGKYCANKCLQGLERSNRLFKCEVEWDRGSIPQLIQEIKVFFLLSLIKDPIAQDSNSKEKILSISFSHLFKFYSSSYFLFYMQIKFILKLHLIEILCMHDLLDLGKVYLIFQS